MDKFSVNDIVEIPCDVQPGAFASEYFVTIKSDETAFSGFVSKDHVKIVRGHEGQIQGKVVEATERHITIQMPGSFFTTASGKASVSRGWARSNLHLAAA